MNSTLEILIGAYVAGAIVGILCWLPYYFGTRRWIWELRHGFREQADEVVAKQEQLLDVSGQLGVKTDQAAKLKRERNDLRRQVAERVQQIANLEREKAKITSEIGSIKKLLTEANRHIDELQSSVQSRDADFERQKAEWLAEQRKLDDLLADKKAEVERLQQQIQKLEADAERGSAAWTAERVRLENALAEALRERVDVGRQSSELSDEITRREEGWNEERESINWQLTEATARAEEQAASISELITRNADLAQKLEQERQSVVSQTERMDVLDRTITVQKSDNTALSEKRIALADDNAHLEKQNLELKRRLAVLARERAPAPVPSQLPATIPGPGGMPRITIGLDFGTHSTKVVFRGQGHADKSWVLHWDEPATGYPNFASPSLVRLDEGKLYFGSAALKKREGKLYHTLKLDLMPIDSKTTEAKDHGDNLSDVLVALYLAWVLRNVRTVLDVEPKKLSLNVGAPMKSRNDKKLRDRYLHVVHAAWELAFGADAIAITQEAILDDLIYRVRELIDKEVPGIADRQFEVLPETLCPIVSLARDPKAWDTGMVMVVDMGAGTTEISINSAANFDGQDYPIQCYWDESFQLGGDDFSENDASGSNLKSHADREDALVRKFMENLRSVWGKGFMRRKIKTATERDGWDKLRILRVGGALQRRRLDKTLGEMRQTPSLNSINDPKRTCKADWHRPAELDFWDQNLLVPAEHLPILGVAHGLSIHRQQWPKFVSPDDIEETDSAEPVDKKPYEPWHNRA